MGALVIMLMGSLLRRNHVAQSIRALRDNDAEFRCLPRLSGATP